MFWNSKPRPTFDDVASEEAKEARRAIYRAAARALEQAANAAIEGDVATSRQRHDDYQHLQWAAITIPLDMIQLKKFQDFK